MEACGPTEHTFYVLDTNVLIHDPNALLNFEEHHVIIPMTVLEELDKLKSGKSSTAADCRQAIRLIDKTLGDAPPDQVEQGVAIERGKLGPNGTLAILMDKAPIPAHCLPNDLNDNKIINQLCQLQSQHPDDRIVLVSKDINMRLKARACGIDAEDYHTDQLLDDIALFVLFLAVLKNDLFFTADYEGNDAESLGAPANNRVAVAQLAGLGGGGEAKQNQG